tara:strand:- start:516 stop:689 length:174 start_codon:yes stop_codon:yes gene_type:complete
MFVIIDFMYHYQSFLVALTIDFSRFLVQFAALLETGPKSRYPVLGVLLRDIFSVEKQ